MTLIRSTSTFSGLAEDLSGFRARFHLPPDTIYLDGNSLGLLSSEAESALMAVIQEWKVQGIGGWLDGRPPWFSIVAEVSRRMAPLVGADAGEVTVGASTTVNLHQLLATLYRPSADRPRILMDALAFPSDRYAAASHLRLRGRDPGTDLIVVSPRDDLLLEEDDLIEAMSEDVQVALLPSVVYTTGQLLDVPRLITEAHHRGCLIGFDCSHSAGLIPHRLSEWDADFAFWCGYKYLNGGPGAAAGLYLNRKHFDKGPGLAGWFSSDSERQFDMSPSLIPARDAKALQIGTPPILSIAPLYGSLGLIAEAGVERIRETSLALTDYMMTLIESELGDCGFRLASPPERDRRGGHIALLHPGAAGICAALKDAGVVPDFRPPNIVRLAPSPLYTSIKECEQALRRLKAIMVEETWRKYRQQRGLVA